MRKHTRQQAALNPTKGSPKPDLEHTNDEIEKRSLLVDDTAVDENILSYNWWDYLGNRTKNTERKFNAPQSILLDDTKSNSVSPFPNWWEHIDQRRKLKALPLQKFPFSTSSTKSFNTSTSEEHQLKKRVHEDTFDTHDADKTEEPLSAGQPMIDESASKRSRSKLPIGSEDFESSESSSMSGAKKYSDKMVGCSRKSFALLADDSKENENKTPKSSVNIQKSKARNKKKFMDLMHHLSPRNSRDIQKRNISVLRSASDSVTEAHVSVVQNDQVNSDKYHLSIGNQKKSSDKSRISARAASILDPEENQNPNEATYKERTYPQTDSSQNKLMSVLPKEKMSISSEMNVLRKYVSPQINFPKKRFLEYEDSDATSENSVRPKNLSRQINSLTEKFMLESEVSLSSYEPTKNLPHPKIKSHRDRFMLDSNVSSSTNDFPNPNLSRRKIISLKDGFLPEAAESEPSIGSRCEDLTQSNVNLRENRFLFDLAEEENEKSSEGSVSRNVIQTRLKSYRNKFQSVLIEEESELSNTTCSVVLRNPTRPPKKSNNPSFLLELAEEENDKSFEGNLPGNFSFPLTNSRSNKHLSKVRDEKTSKSFAESESIGKSKHNKVSKSSKKETLFLANDDTQNKSMNIKRPAVSRQQTNRFSEENEEDIMQRYLKDVLENRPTRKFSSSKDSDEFCQEPFPQSIPIHNKPNQNCNTENDDDLSDRESIIGNQRDMHVRSRMTPTSIRELNSAQSADAMSNLPTNVQKSFPTSGSPLRGTPAATSSGRHQKSQRGKSHADEVASTPEKNLDRSRLITEHFQREMNLPKVDIQNDEEIRSRSPVVTQKPRDNTSLHDKSSNQHCSYPENEEETYASHSSKNKSRTRRNSRQQYLDTSNGNFEIQKGRSKETQSHKPHEQIKPLNVRAELTDEGERSSSGCDIPFHNSSLRSDLSKRSLNMIPSRSLTSERLKTRQHEIKSNKLKPVNSNQTFVDEVNEPASPASEQNKSKHKMLIGKNSKEKVERLSEVTQRPPGITVLANKLGHGSYDEHYESALNESVPHSSRSTLNSRRKRSLMNSRGQQLTDTRDDNFEMIEGTPKKISAHKPFVDEVNESASPASELNKSKHNLLIGKNSKEKVGKSSLKTQKPSGISILANKSGRDSHDKHYVSALNKRVSHLSRSTLNFQRKRSLKNSRGQQVTDTRDDDFEMIEGTSKKINAHKPTNKQGNSNELNLDVHDFWASVEGSSSDSDINEDIIRRHPPYKTPTKETVSRSSKKQANPTGAVRKPGRARRPYWVNAKLIGFVKKAIASETGSNAVMDDVEDVITKLITLVDGTIKYRRKNPNPFIDQVVRHLYHSGLIKTAMNYIIFCMTYLPEPYIQKALRDTLKDKDPGILGTKLHEDLNL